MRPPRSSTWPSPRPTRGTSASSRGGFARPAGPCRRTRGRWPSPGASSIDGRWREAADAWAAIDCPYEGARALLGGLIAAAVQEAHATFDRLGARPAAAMAARRLRELGAPLHPARPARPRPGQTPRDSRAASSRFSGLVAGGQANHEIASRLVLSTRTVDHHVSALLGKLGVDPPRRGRGRGDPGRASTSKTGRRPGPDWAVATDVPAAPSGDPSCTAETRRRRRRDECRATSWNGTFPRASSSRSERPGIDVCRGVVGVNEDLGVTWVHSYIRDDRAATWCIYDAPGPEAIRRAAERNGLPVDRITRVTVLDPYFYTPSQEGGSGRST